MAGVSKVGEYVDQPTPVKVKKTFDTVPYEDHMRKKSLGFDTVPYEDHMRRTEQKNIDIIPYEKQISQKSWALFGSKFPREKIVFLCQFSILSFVVIMGCINLMINDSNNSTWTCLIGTCLGALVPAPKISKKNLKSE